MATNDLDELERQMAMLEGIPSSEEVSSTIVTPVQNSGLAATPASINVVVEENKQAAAQVVQPTTTIPVQTQPVQAAPVQTVPVQTQAPQVQAVQPQTQVNLDIFDDEEAPVFVNISDSVDENKMPFVELKPGESTRIMLFTQKTIQVYTHYIEGLGYLRCLSKRDATGRINMKAPCCEFKDEEGKDKYATCREILPVIEYPVGKDGKSLLANKNPELKFMLITKADRKSLNAIMSDEEKTKAAMDMDFSVTIDANDRFKTKVFSSTFNTIRGQYAEAINAEIAKCTDEMLIKARDERYRKVPVQAIQAELAKSQAANTVANQMMNQNIPTLNTIL